MTNIKAIARNLKGKERCKKLRKLGLIPATIYGDTQETNIDIIVTKKELLKKLSNLNFRSHIINIKLGCKTEKVLTKEIQIHPISDEPIHIDFMKISKKYNINISIPLNFINKNKSPGLKKGAVLNVVQHNVTLKCNTQFIPEKINIDLTGLEVGDSIKANDLTLPEKSTITLNKEITLATIVAPSSLKAQEQIESDEK